MYHNKAYAIAHDHSTVEIFIRRDLCQKSYAFRFYVGGKYEGTFEPISMNESPEEYICTIKIRNIRFVPGVSYEIATEQNIFIPIDISFLSLDEAFEKQYRYEGKLGAQYSKESTKFTVFTPYSTSVILKYRKPDSNHYEYAEMDRDDANGIYSCTIKGDLEGASYNYVVKVFGDVYEVVDPYAFSADSNTKHGYVIDTKKVKNISSKSRHLPPFSDWTKAIIYECSVRDMTSLTTLEDKSTFNAMSENIVTKQKKRKESAIEYIKGLGVSHVQLMPVLDFQTVDDDNPSALYNWGYDPVLYFTLKGAYSSNPNDPYARVYEFKKMVASFHENGLRVVLDVVYNHVFSTEFNSLSILVPKYYQRFNADGTRCNGSGCGNDFASEKYMARKLILDSLTYLVSTYDVDGFRFDLMGLIDIDTIRKGYELLSKKKPEIIYYGEGWDMWTNLDSNKKSSLTNAKNMPYCAFFNDRFRDISKGKTSNEEAYVRGYLSGDLAYKDGFKHIMQGSCIPYAFPSLFDTPKQSVNYCECHDNHTLADKLTKCCPNERAQSIDKRIDLCNSAVMFAAGIPLFHQGQEVAHSKNGEPNSYNLSDKINGFDYSLIESNASHYHYFLELVKAKKKFISLCDDEEYDDIIHHMSFYDLDNGACGIRYDMTGFVIDIIFNPTHSTAEYDFMDERKCIFDGTGMISDPQSVMKAVVSELSMCIYYKEKEAENEKVD